MGPVGEGVSGGTTRPGTTLFFSVDNIDDDPLAQDSVRRTYGFLSVLTLPGTTKDLSYEDSVTEME